MQQVKKMVLLMMVIAGESMGKKIFTDPKIQGKSSILNIIEAFQLLFFGNFKYLFCVSALCLCFAKFSYVSVSVITEHITDARIDSHETV